MHRGAPKALAGLVLLWCLAGVSAQGAVLPAGDAIAPAPQEVSTEQEAAAPAPLEPLLPAAQGAEPPLAEPEAQQEVEESRPPAAPDTEPAEEGEPGAPAATDEEGSSIPYYGRVINVCASETAPVVFCTDRDVSTYAGFEVELAKRVFTRLGWTDASLNWTCADWDRMHESLATGDGMCDIAVAGLSVSTASIEAGYTFTWPTMKGGFKILVSAEEAPVSTWAFMTAFSWQLWVATIATAPVVACVLFVVERWALLGRRLRAPLPGLEQNMWKALGRPMQTSDMISPSTAANVIIIIYAFMMMILVTLYTASTAANLTATRLETAINSVADLPGKAVGTWTDYVPYLQKRGIDAVGYPWDTYDDEEAMFNAVRNGEIKALVLDASFLEYEVATRCDLKVVGELFDQYDQAVAFPASFDNIELLDAYNSKLVELKESGETEMLLKQWATPAEATCSEQQVADAGSQVTLDQVSGLWILLAASIGVAVLLVVISRLLRRGALRVASTKQFRNSVRRVRSSLSASNQRLSSLARAASRRAGSASEGAEGSRSRRSGLDGAFGTNVGQGTGQQAGGQAAPATAADIAAVLDYCRHLEGLLRSREAAASALAPAPIV